MTSSPAALDGVRVLDFSRVLAGPFCTMLLADMGADVIKVEHPHGGDETRTWGPPWAGEGPDRQSAYYLSVNRNKRSLTLNLKQPEGQALARQLAADSHVVIENLRVGQMALYSLGYDHLRALNPALVYCSISGFGQDGPYAARPGYDYVIQAMSGLMSVTGPADGEPSKVGVAVSDVFTGLYAAQAILGALRHAERTGQGQYLDVSLLESQLGALVNVASNYLVSGHVPPRWGNGHPNIVPYQTFQAADKSFVLAVGNDRQFELLCNLLERPDLASNQRYGTNPARVQHRSELVALLNGLFRARPASDWVEALLALGIPSGEINDVADALENAHIAGRGLVQQVELANGATARMVGPAVRMGATPGTIRRPPPTLGQHTDAILRDRLNLSDDALADLRARRVI